VIELTDDASSDHRLGRGTGSHGSVGREIVEELKVDCFIHCDRKTGDRSSKRYREGFSSSWCMNTQVDEQA
jgi:hypothetical protein